MTRNFDWTSVRHRRAIVLLLVAALALPLLPPGLTASAGHFANTEELTATDAAGAAIAFSASTFETADEVLLGRDDDFPDSLASGGGQDTRPLLLTKTDALTETTKAEIERLKAKTVHILGGTGAVSQAVEDALKAMTLTVKRYSGPTRIETAVEVAKNLTPTATTAIIARAAGDAEDASRGFADSLAAGGWAASATMPVLLTETATLSVPTGDYLKSSSIKEVFVVGGNAAVSAAVLAQLTAQGLTVKRVSGPTRFHTALAIAAERGFASAADASKVILTEGQAPDAWTSGFAAAARSKKDNAPIVLSVGDTLPDPTKEFLSAGVTPAPEETPSEEPTAEPQNSHSPSPTPTPDPSGSPTPSPEPETGGGTALLCSPSAATAACDAAATALGQVAGAGAAFITFDVPVVGRYDHAVGKVAEPLAVSSLHVTGCGYTNEPLLVGEDGTVYLMLAEAAGTCSAEFTLVTSAGSRKQTVEFSIGEDFQPPSALELPELYTVVPVSQTAEGVQLRFVFDEPVAPDTAIDHTKFRIHRFDGTFSDGNPDSPAHQPVFITRDPRNPRAVLATFRSAEYEKSTVAYVIGGKGTAADTQTFTAFGGVKDIDNLPNPTGHAPLHKVDFTAANTEKPDLISVGDYRSTDQTLVFKFSEPVNLPAIADQYVGAAQVVLVDGTVKRSDANGWFAGPTEDSLRVSFAGDGLSTADMEKVRRAMVGEPQPGKTFTGVVPSKSNPADFNTAIAIVVAGFGITDKPDFVGYDDENFAVGATGKVNFRFEEDIVDIRVRNTTTDAQNPINTDKAPRFIAVKRSGEVVPAISVEQVVDNKKKLNVWFAQNKLDSTVMYYTVLSDAVTSFTTKKNFADSVRRNAPQIFVSGRTVAPDITDVKSKFTEGTCSIGVQGSADAYEVTYQFDEATTHFATVAPNTKFQAWFTGKIGDSTSATDEKARMVEFDANALNNTTDSLPSAKTPAHGTKITWVPKEEMACANTGTKSVPAAKFWTGPVRYGRVRYLSIDHAAVRSESADPSPKSNYHAGQAIKN